MRVRGFTKMMLIFSVTEEQIQDEVKQCIKTVMTSQYFGFGNIVVELSTRPEQRVGSDEIWDKSESDS